MSDLTIILEALLAQPTPNTPQQTAEDNILYEQHHLITLLQQRLEGHPDAATMIRHYLEAPDIWEGVLADALISNGVPDDPEVQQAARAIINYAEPLDPDEAEGYWP